MRGQSEVDTGVRDFDAVVAQRWSSASRPPPDPIRDVDTFDDEVIRLRSGKYVFKGDLQRAASLESVPVYTHPSRRPAMSGILDKIPSVSDLVAFTVMGFFVGTGWLLAGVTYHALFTKSKKSA